MSDLNNETTVEETVVEESSTAKKAVDPSLQGIQLFYENNKKAVQYIGGGFLLLLVAVVYYKFYHLPEQEKLASNEMFWAQNYFEKDSFNIALNGGVAVMAPSGQKQMMGFLQIAEEYSSTKQGSLAHYCAGICLLRTGKYQDAIEHLKQFNGNDEIVAPIAIGAIGDCYMELKNTDDAINYYLKAADKSRNSFTAPYYLKKAAFGYELKNQFAQSVEVYERIKKEYYRSEEGKDADKEIARLKALGNL